MSSYFDDSETFDNFAPPEDMQQGALAPALRKVHGCLVYVAVFAAGWFASAVYSLGVLKGWW